MKTSGYDKLELEQELKAANLIPAKYDARNAELIEPQYFLDLLQFVSDTSVGKN
jgi:hypothetical protein